MNEGRDWVDETMVPLLAYMCTIRSLKDAEQRLKRAERDCARRGAHLVEGYLRAEQSDLRTAVLALFHAKCLANPSSTSSGHSGCHMDKNVEKAVMVRWSLLRRQCLFEDDLVALDRERGLALMAVEMTEMKLLGDQVDEHIRKRNELAYNIMRRYFGPALIKCLRGGMSALGPGERLLCDYNSVAQLNLCKDTDNVFELAARWLFRVDHPPKRASSCYKCQKKRPHKSRGVGLDCPLCGVAWFCSIQCQLNDESENVFAHMHECEYQRQRRRVRQQQQQQHQEEEVCK